MAEIIISSIALVVSILSAIFSFRLNKIDSRRSVREQLNRTVGELIKLNAENNAMWFVPAGQRDHLYYHKLGTISQTSASLSRQAVYLAEHDPDLVSDVEFATIAQGLVIAGDQLQAEAFYEKAIKASPSPYYKVVNTRVYADFLFRQGKYQMGRNTYQQALGVLNDDSEFTKYTNGFTCQMWMVSEFNSRFEEEAERYYNQARRLFEKLSNPVFKESIIRGLEKAREGSSAQAIVSGDQTRPPAGT
jgi:tetratricopeptide (TPR) repeat protein